MEDSPNDADKNNIFFAEDTEQDSHCAETEDAAAQTVGEGHHLSGYQAGGKDTHYQTEKSVFLGSV